MRLAIVVGHNSASQGAVRQDTGEIIDMDAAATAQAALVFWTADSETPPPQASTTALTAIGGMDGPAALAGVWWLVKGRK